MGCSSCNDVERVEFPPEVRLELRTQSNRVEGRDGQAYVVHRSLIPLGHTPRGGWAVKIELKGQIFNVLGTSSHYVFAEVKRLIKINDIDISDLDVWFNLNIQWVKRAVEKYQVVPLENIQALIK